ncbi:thioesterase II family protein [Chitinimonas lacunae]|uniref:Thioesterase II family protein n=1 Tax=Chitinimonas lacunae TaxID=1963018 RepID=A0ABV8MPE4_9NEIS
MTGASTDPWFPFGLGGEAPLRLFCLPYAGGGASNFLPWRLALRPWAVAPVQYPGHETHLHAPCLRDFGTMVEALAQALLPYLDRPYGLFGYSMGARLALALENRLAELGCPPPQQLWVAANRAPDGVAHHQGVSALPQAEFIEYVRRYDGVPEMVLADPEWSEMVFRVLRHDFALIESATLPRPSRCPLIGYCGRDDDSANAALMAGWAAYAPLGFVLREFVGGHFFLRSAPEFLACLGTDLAALHREASHAS